MSENSHEFLRDGLAFAGVLALGLLAGWLVLKVQKPEPATNPWWAPETAAREPATGSH